MIGVSSSSRDFAALAAYLARGRGDDAPERVAWTASRNIPTNEPDVAATIMHASAARNARVTKPVYHLAISFDPGDCVDRRTMEHVADRILGALGLGDHQALIIAHQDREHPHLHLMINRVHPETGRAWSRWQDQRVVQRVLREEELALGLRRVPGRLAPTPQLDAFGRAPRDAAAEGRTFSALAASERKRDDELARTVKELERAVAARAEHLASHIAVQAARAQLGELDTATRRASHARAEYQRALAVIYRDPESAHSALQSEIRRVGIADSLAQLAREPERLGVLRASRQPWLGILSRPDTGPARRAAPYVAGKARAAFEAEGEARALASASRVRAAQEQFTRALSTVYRDPEAARRAFEGLARTEGAARALEMLRAEPNRIGELRPVAPNGGEGPSVAAAVIAGRHFLALEGVARTVQAGERPAALDSFMQALAAARSGVSKALAEHSVTRAAARSQPPRPQHDHRLHRAISRLLPTDLARISLALSKPARALVAKVRRSIREVILERDREPG